MIIARNIVHGNPDEYSAFPSLSINHDNLFCVFRVEPQMVSKSHINTKSKAILKSSSDNGKTWQVLSTLEHSKYCGIQDPSILVVDNEFIISYFVWCGIGGKHAKKLKNAMMLGPYTQVSQDGIYWGEPVLVKDTGPQMATSEPVVLAGNKYLLPAYCNFGSGYDCIVLLSKIKQGHWKDYQKIAEHDNLDLQEPTLLNCGGKHLLCLMRSREGLYQVHSWDNGKTWTTPKFTGIIGLPPSLLKLKDGRLLVTYGYRKPPYGIRACVSRNEGVSWDTVNEIVLCTDGGGWDIGYPSTVQLTNGNLLTVFYFYTKQDKTRRIESIEWKL